MMWHDAGGKVVGAALAVAVLVGVGWLLSYFCGRRSDASEATVQELQETVECFRGLVAALPNLVFLLGSDGVRLLNSGAQEAWQASPDHHLTLDDIAASPRDVAQLGRLLAQDGVQRTRLRLRDVRGQVLMCEVVAGQTVLRGEEVVIADARDVGAREELEQQIRLADRLGAIGTLAAGIAHEINDPLTYIASNLEYVRDRLSHGDDELNEALDDVSAGVGRVTAIVQEMRQFSGLDDSGHGSTPLARPLRFALRLTKDVLRHSSKVVRFDDDLPLVQGDDSRLSQIFVNVLTTAAESMPPGRSASVNRVIVESSVTPSTVEIVVRDNGQGMTSDELDRVLDPFYTEPGDRDSRLGLSISRGIVEQLGGEMAVESAPGVGTTVSMRLPRSEPVVRPGHQPPSNVQSDAAQRVLLIDDEPNVLRGMTRVLSREYDLVTADSGAAALDLLRSGDPFDAVLCDMMMPKMTGGDVLKWLEQHRPELTHRFAIVTGGPLGPEQERLLEHAAVPILRKPLTRAELIEVISRLSD